MNLGLRLANHSIFMTSPLEEIIDLLLVPLTIFQTNVKIAENHMTGRIENDAFPLNVEPVIKLLKNELNGTQ